MANDNEGNMEVPMDFRFGKEHSLLEQDLSLWRDFYSKMKDAEKKVLKDKLASLAELSNVAKYPNLSSLYFRIHFLTESIHYHEGEVPPKNPYLRPKLLLKAIECWDRGDDFAPTTEELFHRYFHDLIERD